MRSFPDALLAIIIPYAALFPKLVFAHIEFLLAGTILVPGKRTMSAVLRIKGLSDKQNFHKKQRKPQENHRLNPAAAAITLLAEQLHQQGKLKIAATT